MIDPAHVCPMSSPLVQACVGVGAAGLGCVLGAAVLAIWNLGTRDRVRDLTFLERRWRQERGGW